MNVPIPELGRDPAATAERRWAIASVVLIAFILAVIAFTGIHWASMPPSGSTPQPRDVGSVPTRTAEVIVATIRKVSIVMSMREITH